MAFGKRRRANRRAVRALTDAGLPVSGRPDVVGACDRALKILSADPAVEVGHNHYRAIVAGLRAGGAPDELVTTIDRLVDLAHAYDSQFEPLIRAAAEMAPIFGVDASPSTDAAAALRSTVAFLLIAAAKWPPTLTGASLDG